MKHLINKTLLLLLLALVGTVKAQLSEWAVIETGVTEDLYDICRIDDNTIFVSGENGVILKSTDGGRSWQEKHRNPDWEIFCLQFADENVGYGFVLKNRNPFCLLKTVDSGESWFLVDPFALPDKSLFSHREGPFHLFEEGKPMELFVLNADTVFIRDYDYVARSIDGGLTFTDYYDNLGFAQDTGGGDDRIGIKGEYFEGEWGWLVGYDNENRNTLRVMKTEDCGDHWENIANYTFSDLHILAVYPGKDRCAKIYGEFIDYNGTGASYYVIETNDGFEHVTMSPVNGSVTPVWFAYWDVDFNSDGLGCIFNSLEFDKDSYVDNRVFVTYDGGAFWNDVSPEQINDFLYDVKAIGSAFLIASQHGRLYRFGDAPYSIGEASVKTPTENTTIRLYDLQGRLLLAKPFDPNVSIGSVLSCSSLKSGIYVWEIWNGTQKKASGKWVKEGQ